MTLPRLGTSLARLLMLGVGVAAVLYADRTGAQSALLLLPLAAGALLMSGGRPIGALVALAGASAVALGVAAAGVPPWSVALAAGAVATAACFVPTLFRLKPWLTCVLGVLAVSAPIPAQPDINEVFGSMAMERRLVEACLSSYGEDTDAQDSCLHTAYSAHPAFARAVREAARDVAAGRLRVLTYGLRMKSSGGVPLRAHGVEEEPIAGCWVTPEITARAYGYNLVSKAVIEERFGPQTSW